MALIVDIPPVTSGGAPTTATYITQTPDAGLSAEQALSLLATGLLFNTTGTGALSIAVAGTNFVAPAGTAKVSIDLTGDAANIPLTVKNGKSLSGVELWVTGTAATGYILRNAAGTLHGVFGISVAANEWTASGAAAGDVVLVGGAPGVAQKLLIKAPGDNGVQVLSKTSTGVGSNGYLEIYDGGTSIGQAGVRLSFDSSRGTFSAAAALVNSTSLAAVALQVQGDPNTGMGPIGGADTFSGVAGGTEMIRWSATQIGVFTKVASPAVQQTSGANLTNSVTSGGTDDTIANYTDLTIYANDSAAIRNDIYQLARKVKQINDGLRLIGWFT